MGRIKGFKSFCLNENSSNFMISFYDFVIETGLRKLRFDMFVLVAFESDAVAINGGELIPMSCTHDILRDNFGYDGESIEIRNMLGTTIIAGEKENPVVYVDDQTGEFKILDYNKNKWVRLLFDFEFDGLDHIMEFFEGDISWMKDCRIKRALTRMERSIDLFGEE